MDTTPDIGPLLRERLRNSLAEDGFSDEEIEAYMAWMESKLDELRASGWGKND